MELNQDFQEFLKSFVKHDVRFLIIGGYALAAHGHPRYTKDLDVWVGPNQRMSIGSSRHSRILVSARLALRTPTSLNRELSSNLGANLRESTS